MFRKAFVAPLFAAVLGVGMVSILPLSHNSVAVAADNDQAKKDIIDTATGPGMEQVTTLVTAIKAADLVDALKGEGPFTVFAPTNEAFAKLPKETLDDLLKPENKEKLKMILLYHVHKGDAIMAADVKTMKLSTLDDGKNLKVKVKKDGTVMINNAKVVKTDVMCSNGVIHWIDTVLMP
ncbi:MAG TPA: fasciclin domain-containing protein [Tepidisphaeraceae bacterium]|nr:fasciclin domain-containing protein [Tepidisphaeraceae bacterium]